MFCLTSCGGTDPELRKELEAANDRIRVLILNNQTLEDSIGRLEAEFEKDKKHLKEMYKNETGTITENYRQKIADLESQIADLRMELSITNRQRLALQEAVDQPDRLKVLQEDNFAMERMVWIITICLCIIFAVVVSLKSLAYRNSRRENVVRLISELPHHLSTK